MDKIIEERNKELLRKAERYRDYSGTLSQMTRYYGDKYTNALERAGKGEPYACCLLGHMFKESIIHAKENYEYPVSDYRKLTKIYYELAANRGYADGMYYLGEICLEDEDFEQAEKWFIKAAEEGLSDAYIALGSLYYKLWKTIEDMEYLWKAVCWTQKSLEKKATAEAFKDMGDLCRELITNGCIKDPEKQRKRHSDIKKYYLKALELSNYPQSILEELVAVCMGDYGHECNIEEAFEYGKQALGFRSGYAALYFYTRSKGGCFVKRNMYTASRYYIAFLFLKDLEKEGISIPDKVWEEIEAERKDAGIKSWTRSGFSTDVVSVLADLNIKYNIIDMEEFQKNIREPVLSFDMPDTEVLNLRSEYYGGGMLDKLDKKYLKEYTDHLITEIKKSSSTEQIQDLYKELVALLDYASQNSRPMRCIYGCEKIGYKVAAKVSDTYLDAVFGGKLSEKLEECFRQPEIEFRRQCHEGYQKNWPDAYESIISVYPDFLDRSEEKWQKEMELAEEADGKNR